jgi:SagB-type dehydrogenase family enzyme
MIPETNSRALSTLFHLNSEPWLNHHAYENAANQLESQQPSDHFPRIPLPSTPSTTLQTLISSRGSCRAFGEDSLSIESFSSLLSLTYGLTRKSTLGDGSMFLHRAVPSPGGLYPLEILTLVQRVESIANGLYRYLPHDQALTPVRVPAAFQEFEKALLAYPFIQTANVVFFIVAVFERSQKKYGPRGYRYIYLEAGHAAQNLCLAATELKLGSLCIGGFFDSALNRLLGLLSNEEGAVYAVAAGIPVEMQ